MNVEISIGPVPSASAKAWIDTATATIAAVRARPDLGVPDDVADDFERYVEEWRAVADRSEEFRWSGHIEPALARRLAAHWLKLVTIARERPVSETGIAPSPPAAQAFFEALAGAMTAASGADDGEPFATVFEQTVPGFDERRPPHADTRPPTRVLIVDDNADMRMLFRSILEVDTDFEVVGEAANGQEALDLARSACPDAVILDVMMPVMDGLTALPLLRDACPAAAVTIVTAVPNRDVMAAAERHGATGVLSKSAPFRVLKEAIRPPQ